MLTFEQIKELLELVGKREIEELEIERTGYRIRIVAQSQTSAGQLMAQPSAHVVADTGSQPAVNGGPERSIPVATESAEATEAEPLRGSHTIASPIVGTFYAAPSPEADPYTQVGDTVRKGQVLCIVEAMKLMNEIESDVDGVVLEVYPKNAQPVEFGEPLFSIQPA